MTDKHLSFRNKFRNRHRRKRLKPLTICIAAICEENTPNPKIIFAADKLITTNWIQFESGLSKIGKITNYCYAMISSDNSLKSDMILRSAITEVANRNLQVEEIAKILAKKLHELKIQTMEKDILQKYNLTYKDFTEGKLSKDLIEIITSEIRDYEYQFDTEFVVAGIDFSPHIYVVSQDGEYLCNDYIGYAISGAGYPLAFSEMTKYLYNGTLTASEVLVRIFSAKKSAERIGGVGISTTLFILEQTENMTTKEKLITKWDIDAVPELMKILNDGINDMKKKEGETYVGVIQKVNEYFQKIKTGNINP